MKFAEVSDDIRVCTNTDSSVRGSNIHGKLVRVTSHSNPSSPLLEEYPSQSLNDAMVEDSLVDISRSSSLVLQELTGDQAADVRKSSASSIQATIVQGSQAQSIANSLPAFLQQSMILTAPTPTLAGVNILYF